MDMQKKLEETYLSDKEIRNPRLLVGLSGGINSFVAASLLKIQKYELIAVTILPSWDGYMEDQSKILSCHVSAPKLEQIKNFCHQLGLTHITLKASEEFTSEVADLWLARRISATKSSACWSCHELRMRLLWSKMKELGAQGVATGHLAKIFHHQAHKSVYVHSSNDEVHDQSGILSRLPQEILEKLHLPLCDLQQKEVIKLAENFGILSSVPGVAIHSCFELTQGQVEALKTRFPVIYQGEGSMSDGGKNTYAEHSGIINFEYGQKLDPYTVEGQELYVRGSSLRESKLLVAPETYFSRNKILLNHCKISQETSWLWPMKGVIKTSRTMLECWLYPKGLASALVELENAATFHEGEVVTVFNKTGKNAKVFLTGVVRFFESTPKIKQGEQSEDVDFSRDF
jgi:tRNA-uridine 2-sulfurtransferase